MQSYRPRSMRPTQVLASQPQQQLPGSRPGTQPVAQLLQPQAPPPPWPVGGLIDPYSNPWLQVEQPAWTTAGSTFGAGGGGRGVTSAGRARGSGRAAAAAGDTGSGGRTGEGWAKTVPAVSAT